MKGVTVAMWRYPAMALVLVAALAAVGCAMQGSGPVAAAAPYDRSEFGGGWADLDGDGCDTRDEVLARDALGATVVGPDGCVDEVAIIDPYTGRNVDGRANIDIDHVVALADAWGSGAWRWTDGQRRRFANDERNLLATADEVNASKGDRGPDRWRPPARAGWCTYVRTYAAVKAIYRLETTAGQRAALLRTGASCPLSRGGNPHALPP